MSETKSCKGCGPQPLVNFHKDKSHKDGLGTYCKLCIAVKGKLWRESNPEKATTRGKNWAANNPEKQKIRAKNWSEANPGKNAARTKKWRENNPDKKKLQNQQWVKNNPCALSAVRTKRRTAKIKRDMTSWDSELNNFVLTEAHRLCKCRKLHTNIDWHVDHIIPLQGKRVSGLHVWNNLQVIPKTINLIKSNKFEVVQ